MYLLITGKSTNTESMISVKYLI